MVFLFQNCSVVNPGADGRSASDLSLASSIALTSAAMKVLNTKCVGCHNSNIAEGNISGITDLNYLLYYRLVIPGQPDISDLIRVIKDGSMPPSGPLSVEEIEAVSKWVLSGLIDGGGVILPGGGAPLEAKFSILQTRIFNNRCVSCHRPGATAGGVNMSTYAGVSAALARIVPAVRRPGANFMPAGGTRLTVEEDARQRLGRYWIGRVPRHRYPAPLCRVLSGAAGHLTRH